MEHPCGEYDIFAFKKSTKPNQSYLLIFEVKGKGKSHSRRNARTQLRKDNTFIREKYGTHLRFFNFYVYSSDEYEIGKSDKAYTIEWMRRL